VDSFDRYIYIHGTNHPEKFPENISAGCLTMMDDALIDLYEKIAEGTHVFILV
jgi:lipoprotein-anchoring transpeptidase ErfK/SrfK